MLKEIFGKQDTAFSESTQCSFLICFVPVCDISHVSIFFKGILKEKQSPESLFGNWNYFGTQLSTMINQCNYQNLATCVVLASLASGSAVSGPT